VQRNAHLVDKTKLKNALALAIGGVDTAENGLSKVRQVTKKVQHNIGPGTCLREHDLLCAGDCAPCCAGAAGNNEKLPKTYSQSPSAHVYNQTAYPRNGAVVASLALLALRF